MGVGCAGVGRQQNMSELRTCLNQLGPSRSGQSRVALAQMSLCLGVTNSPPTCLPACLHPGCFGVYSSKLTVFACRSVPEFNMNALHGSGDGGRGWGWGIGG